MAVYSIFFTASAQKELNLIPKADLKRIMDRIGALAQNPRPVGSEKLSGQERYRIRQGNYRIVYSIEDLKLTVLVVKVAHRRDVYR